MPHLCSTTEPFLISMVCRTRPCFAWCCASRFAKKSLVRRMMAGGFVLSHPLSALPVRSSQGLKPQQIGPFLRSEGTDLPCTI